MDKTQTPHPVSDTAALVMLWAEAYYQKNPLIRRYMEALDLTPGIPLLECYNRICPWYSEVIVNRKHFIRHAVIRLLKKTDGKAIVANLGAGFSPLALELRDHLSSDRHFIELDLDNAPVKQRIYRAVAPESPEIISCIPADITDTGSLLSILKGCGEPGSLRLIVVMEGLSYYIDQQAMQQVIQALERSFPHLSIVFEHLKPCRQISSDRRFIPYDIFSHVRDYTGLPKMTTYAKEEIIGICGDGFTCTYSNMDRMELERIGRPDYFPTPEDGWLSVAVLSR